MVRGDVIRSAPIRNTGAAVLVLLLGLAVAACAPTVTTITSSGISVPGAPMLTAFDLHERCPLGQEARSCTDEALEVAGEILQQLGGPLPPAEFGGELILPFPIDVERNPAWEWSSSNGERGTTLSATIDLEPFLAGRGDAVVRLGGDDPGYAVPDALAEALVDTLFLPGD